MASDENPAAAPEFDWEKTLDEAPVSPPAEKAPAKSPDKAAVQESREDGIHNLTLLLDIPLEITAELGRARMIVNDLLQLGQGSVIELNKLAGEPLEILVNQKLIARGEVVVVNEKFGIRLTDILSPMERIKQLG